MGKEQKLEDSIKEIEQIVEKIENGDISLEESINLYKEGVKILEGCSKKLDKIEKELIVIKDSDLE